MTASALALSNLRELAQAATPGPWYWEPGDEFLHTRIGVQGHLRGVGDYSIGVLADDDDRPEPGTAEADAAYIAACSPDAILALLDQLDAAQEALRLANKALLDAYHGFDADPLGDDAQVDHYHWRRAHKEAIARARQEEP